MSSEAHLEGSLPSAKHLLQVLERFEEIIDEIIEELKGHNALKDHAVSLSRAISANVALTFVKNIVDTVARGKVSVPRGRCIVSNTFDALDQCHAS